MFRRFTAALVAAGLASVGLAAVAPDASARPSFCQHDRGHAKRDAAFCAKSGDILTVRVGDVHPTQPSLGYDEVYYKLGRYTLGKDELNKKFADWCEASGLSDVAWARPDARLDDPTSFGCTLSPGQETDKSRAAMKTIVIGPQGSLWLTDGHHTLTAFDEVADGGPDTPVRLRVVANLSALSTSQFWAQMKANKWTWLQDPEGRTIKPQQLPSDVGLQNFRNDRYRGLMYFVRDVGYSADGAIPFQEFYWGAWLREQHPELTQWDRSDRDAYLAQVRAVADAQVALPAGTAVFGGYTKEQLQAFTKVDTKEFGKLAKPYSDSKPGKLAYLIEYKQQHGVQ